MRKEIIDILSIYENILSNKTSINEASLLGGSSFKWGGGPSDHGGRKLGNWQSDNAWDIMTNENSPVYSISDGTISKLSGSDKLSSNGVVYGYNITVDTDNNSIFYTHLGKISSSLRQGGPIKKGELLGYVGKPKENPKWPTHVHIGIKSGDIKQFIGNDAVIIGASNVTTEPSTDAATGTTKGAGVQDPFGVKKLDRNDPAYKQLQQTATQMNLKEEKIYSKLGDRISSKFGDVIIPSSNNNKIKSPVNGVINNYHSDRSCNNQITIEHSIEGKSFYIQFCGISNPEVRDGRRVSKGDILGNTSKDVTVSLYDKGWSRLNLSTMLDKEIKIKEKSADIVSKKKNDKDNKEYKKETKYYDPLYPWIVKKLHDKIPSMTKGGEPKIKNFFDKYGMTSKKVDENVERIKTLLK